MTEKIITRDSAAFKELRRDIVKPSVPPLQVVSALRFHIVLF